MNIVAVLVGLFLAIGAIVADKLISNAQAKKKDATINDLLRTVNNLTSQKETAEKAEKTAQQVANQTAGLASQRVDSTERTAPLAEQARQVMSEQDAIALANRQVEANR